MQALEGLVLVGYIAVVLAVYGMGFHVGYQSSGVSVAPQEQTAYPPAGVGVGSGIAGGVSTGPGSVVGAGAGSGSAGSGVGGGVGSGSVGAGMSGVDGASAGGVIPGHSG